MIKKYLLFVLMSLMPAMLMAQAAGGTIKRPAKKTQTTTNTQSKKQTAKKQTQPMTQARKERILQNLINNMVYIEGGTFFMGVENGDFNSHWDKSVKPRHQVTISVFKINKYEVTQEEWQAVMGSNPSKKFKGAKRPVTNVSWNDCHSFISKLNEMTGRKFRLPTEAEWEYAARGGNCGHGYRYAGSNDANNVAWYDKNSGYETHPVGLKQANELGLYDMSGNVQEWCQDWYGDYSGVSQKDPTGPDNGEKRVYRGGECQDMEDFLIVIDRRGEKPSNNLSNYRGFRLAL